MFEITKEERKRLAPLVYRCLTCKNSDQLKIAIDSFKDEPNLFWLLSGDLKTPNSVLLNACLGSPYCPPSLLQYYLFDKTTREKNTSLFTTILRNPNLSDNDLINFCLNSPNLFSYELQTLCNRKTLPEEVQKYLIDKGKLLDLIKAHNLTQKSFSYAQENANLLSQEALAIELVLSTYPLSEKKLLQLLHANITSKDFKKILAQSHKITETIARFLVTDKDLFASRELSSNPKVPRRYRKKIQIEQKLTRNSLESDPGSEASFWEPPFYPPLAEEYEISKTKRLAPALEIMGEDVRKYALPFSSFLLVRTKGRRTWSLISIKPPHFVAKLSLPQNLTGSPSYLEDPITKQIFLADFYSQEDGAAHSILIPGSIPDHNSNNLQEMLSALEGCPLESNFPPLEKPLYATPKAHLIYEETLITLWAHQDSNIGWTVETEGAKNATHSRKIYARELNPWLSTYLLKSLETTLRPLLKAEIAL